MNRYDHGVWKGWMAKRMVAALDSLHVPAALFERLDDLFATDRGMATAHAPTATRPRSTVGSGSPSSAMTSK